MLHSRKNNNKIKHLDERCLRLIYSDKRLSCEKILEKDNSISTHHKNIQALAIEMFKVKHSYAQKSLVIFLWKGQKASTICPVVLIL